MGKGLESLQPCHKLVTTLLQPCNNFTSSLQPCDHNVTFVTSLSQPCNNLVGDPGRDLAPYSMATHSEFYNLALPIVGK